MKSLKIALAALVGLVAVSCYNDFDTPAPQKLYTADDMAAMGLTRITIAEVKEKFGPISNTGTNDNFSTTKTLKFGTRTCQRAASIVLATDNVVSGDPTYTLQEALDLTKQAEITVDGLFSGPQQSESEQTTKQFESEIESHGGVFLTQSNGASVAELVKQIESRRNHDSAASSKAAISDAPGWWTLALAVAIVIWLLLAWRLRR